MENVSFEITDDDELIIRCDLKQSLRWSRRGRTIMIACSGGNVLLWTRDGQQHPTGAKLNLSLFRPATQEEIRKEINHERLFPS